MRTIGLLRRFFFGILLCGLWFAPASGQFAKKDPAAPPVVVEQPPAAQPPIVQPPAANPNPGGGFGLLEGNEKRRTAEPINKLDITRAEPITPKSVDAAKVWLSQASPKFERATKSLLAKAAGNKEARLGEIAVEIGTTLQVWQMVEVLIQKGGETGGRLAAQALALRAWLAANDKIKYDGEYSLGDALTVDFQKRRAVFYLQVGRLLSSKDPVTQELAILAAAWGRCRKLSPLVAKIRSQDFAIRAAKVLYLACIGESVSLEEVKLAYQATVGRADKPFTEVSPLLHTYEMRSHPLAYICEAVGMLDATDYLQMLHQLTEHADLRVQKAALLSVGQKSDAASLTLLKNCVTDEKAAFPSRVWALYALGGMPQERVTPFLIEQLEKLKGRLRLDAMLALRRTSGEELALNPDAWIKWWKREQDKKKGALADAKSYYYDEKDEPTSSSFYGIPIFSKGIVFVLDISGSMNGPISMTSASASPQKPGTPRMSRMNSVILNTNKALGQLEAGTLFNIVAFSTRVKVLNPTGMVDTSKVKQVQYLVSQLKPTATTATYNAYERATHLKGNTLFLLSDGEPNGSKFGGWISIVPAVKIANRYRPLAVHCVEFGALPTNYEAMKKMADENFGVAVTPQ